MLKMQLHLQGTRSGYCVPYALYSVAQYFGIPCTKGQMVKLVKALRTEGTCLIDAIDGAGQIGIQFTRIKLCHREIAAALRRKNPVAVSFRDGPDSEHFSIIVDIFNNRRNIPFVTLSDSFYGLITVPLDFLWVLASRDDFIAPYIYELKHSP